MSLVFTADDALGKLESAAALLKSRRVLEIGGEAVLGVALDAFRRSADPATGAPWPALRPNTVAARRKGSNKPLLNNGTLRASFGRGGNGNIWREGAHTLVVGSAMPIAVWQAKGTKPYTIRPRRRKALRFWGKIGPTIGRVTGRGRNWVFARIVHHPGLPPRPMLGYSAADAARIEGQMAAEMDRALE
jgi:Phage virion morphogenesis family